MAVIRFASRPSWSMFVAAHRAHDLQERNREGKDRVLIFTPDPNILRWIEHELFGGTLTPQIVESIADLVTTLTLAPPPWPQLLILDVAPIDPGDVALLGTIRDAGWLGMVITIGEPSQRLSEALGVDVVLDRSFACETLRPVIEHVVDATTRPIRKVTG